MYEVERGTKNQSRPIQDSPWTEGNMGYYTPETNGLLMDESEQVRRIHSILKWRRHIYVGRCTTPKK